MPIVSEQRCWDCCEVLPAAAFGKKVTRPSGLADQCRTCKRAADAAYYRANRARILAKQKADRAENADVRESRNAASRAWRADPQNTARMNDRVIAWKLANPERWNEIHRRAHTRRRARKNSAPTHAFTPQQLAARMAFFGNACWMCGGAFEHVDHVKPLAKGGPHMLANLRPACASCNSRKGARWEGVAGLVSRS